MAEREGFESCPIVDGAQVIDFVMRTVRRFRRIGSFIVRLSYVDVGTGKKFETNLPRRRRVYLTVDSRRTARLSCPAVLLPVRHSMVYPIAAYPFKRRSYILASIGTQLST